jgi:hypothetical protein
MYKQMPEIVIICRIVLGQCQRTEDRRVGGGECL